MTLVVVTVMNLCYVVLGEFSPSFNSLKTFGIFFWKKFCAVMVTIKDFTIRTQIIKGRKSKLKYITFKEYYGIR